MIRKVRGEEIPVCVEIIKKSFLTVADEYGFTEKNAPRFTAFATTQDRLYWHMDCLLYTSGKYKVQLDEDVKYISSNCSVDDDGIVTTDDSDENLSYIVY